MFNVWISGFLTGFPLDFSRPVRDFWVVADPSADSDSNEVAVSVLRRNLLGNEAAPSPLKKVEDILSKNHPSLQVTVTSVECSTNH